MVSKCANPECSASFRYLHEGRIINLELTVGTIQEFTDARVVRRVETYWLCSECCTRMTLAVVHGQVVTQPLPKGQSVGRGRAA